MKYEISQKVILQFPTVFAHLVLFFFTDFSCNSNSLSVTCFLAVFWKLSAAEFFSAVCKVCIRIAGFISHVSFINSNCQQMINNNEMSTNICYVTFTRANHKILGQVSSTWISNILTNFICTSVMFITIWIIFGNSWKFFPLDTFQFVEHESVKWFSPWAKSFDT